MRELYGITFNGNEASPYAVEHGYLDYATLAKSFDCVYNSEIIKHYDAMFIHGDFEGEVAQWYIISENGAEILQRWTDELVMYVPELDLYLWGVTHYGTSWDYVLTDIKLNCK